MSALRFISLSVGVLVCCSEDFKDVYLGPLCPGATTRDGGHAGACSSEQAGGGQGGAEGGTGGTSGGGTAGLAGAGGGSGGAGGASGGGASAGGVSGGGQGGCAGESCPCQEGEARCQGDAVEVCSQQVWIKQGQQCAFGCSKGACAEVTQLAAGRDTTYALFSDGSVRTWGANPHGELGAGVVGGNNPKPATISALAGVSQIAAHTDHVCALGQDGLVRCWGRNHKGQVGGEGTEVSTPRVVAGLEGVSEVSVGGRHSCARLKDGRVMCWGDGGHGQLGQGQRQDAASPVQVIGLEGALQLALGEARSCARLSSGVVCWGLRGGQEPAPETDDDLMPTVVSGTQGLVEVRAGAYFACGLGTKVSCWGGNESKQLGREAPAFDGLAKEISALSDAKQLAVGQRHACVALSNGAVKCWGENLAGQLGKSPGQAVASPLSVPGLFDAVGVAAGEAHSCALRPKSQVSCWGRNAEGQLGTGTTGTAGEPVTVSW